MSEPPFKSRWKPALGTRNNPKSALPSSRPSMFAANDHETVSLLRIRDRTIRAAIGQPSRTPSNTTSQIVLFGGVVVSSVVQGWCAVFIGGTALHTRSDPPISSKLIRILFWQKVPLPARLYPPPRNARPRFY
ncbi:hypothetical protein NA56DRAFT_419989 [Hyaloscypha hepaticicola]|uniref:Uncharacterized protein n=1 Tax=Hyaloscypha hepaticicola TaxID=2082293 RepID=A0A2J6PHM4_9HELO|nr:hypothetical protein NA56DRAFT_419989 [Hyaloscypha hepaticicola]